MLTSKNEKLCKQKISKSRKNPLKASTPTMTRFWTEIEIVLHVAKVMTSVTSH